MNLSHLIGIGLRHPHFNEVLITKPSIGWLEVHSENFFFNGGNAINTLTKIVDLYPLSLHGVGLSLGSAEGLQELHLHRLKKLIDLTNPILVSEHLSWGYVNGKYLSDLLPVPYTKESMEIFVKNISQTQNFLQREILIENPSSYIEYNISEYQEQDFLIEICRRSGAKILLDVNNIYVSCCNHGWDPIKYIDAIPQDLVKEIHLAGHSIKELAQEQVLRIDTHDNYVCDEVWRLYNHTISRFGTTPTLLEWDAAIPSLDVLIQEANKSLHYLNPAKSTVYA